MIFWSFGLWWPFLAFMGLFGLCGLGWFFKAETGLCWWKLSTIDLFSTIRCQNQSPNEIGHFESVWYKWLWFLEHTEKRKSCVIVLVNCCGKQNYSFLFCELFRAPPILKKGTVQIDVFSWCGDDGMKIRVEGTFLWVAEGQLISKCPFGIIVWTKNQCNYFWISVLNFFCSFLGASWKLFGASCRLPCLWYYILSAQEAQKAFRKPPGKKSGQKSRNNFVGILSKQ